MKAERLPTDFRRLLAAHAISLLGSQITFVALPLVAVVSLRATPQQMGLLTAVGYAPYLLLGLIAGAWIDRLRRRPILIAADLCRAALIGTIPIAVLTDSLSLPHLAAVAFAAGALTLCFDVAQDAYLPTLLPRERLVVANSRLATATTAAETAGQGLGSLLVQALTAPFALLLDGLSFIASAVFLITIRTNEPPNSGRVHEPGALRREIGEGLRLVWTTPILRAVTASGAILQFTGGIYDALQALFIIDSLGLPPFVYGLLFAAGSISGLLGTLFATSLMRQVGPGPLILGSALAISLGWLTMPLAFGTPGTLLSVLITGAAIRGVGNTLYNIGVASVRQSIVPRDLLGRVNSAGLFVAWGMLPLGALAGGGLGELFGVRETLLIGSLIRVVLLFVCCAAPLLAFRAIGESPNDTAP